MVPFGQGFLRLTRRRARQRVGGPGSPGEHGAGLPRPGRGPPGLGGPEPPRRVLHRGGGARWAREGGFGPQPRP
eukprot:7139363-Lingulodinium_polyedra.AAC.1